jgi:hypothetical protein
MAGGASEAGGAPGQHPGVLAGHTGDSGCRDGSDHTALQVHVKYLCYRMLQWCCSGVAVGVALELTCLHTFSRTYSHTPTHTRAYSSTLHCSGRLGGRVSVLPLHGSLSLDEQQRVFLRPQDGYRKVIIFPESQWCYCGVSVRSVPQ